MHVVSILFKGSDLALAQHFKAHKNAQEFKNKALAYLKDGSGILENEDDFCSIIAVDGGSISAVSYTDVEKDLDKNGQIQILQHRSQLKTQNLAQNDGTIKLLTPSSKLTA